MILEIKEIRFKICDHKPKAQSVCIPNEKVTLEEFGLNLRKQLKQIYESQRSTKVPVR